jgi:large subunit ribosomal protein L4e
MMKAKISELNGAESGELELPTVFATPIREDIIHKTYVNLLSHGFQKQGRFPNAGEVVSAESRNTGQGIARIARARGEGFQRAGQAAGVGGIRHGRVAHPPESWKMTYKKINKKEKRYGLCSSIAATGIKSLVERRGHRLGKITDLPIIVSNDIEAMAKTKDLKNALLNLGIGEDLKRVEKSKSSSGTRRRRGRKGRAGKSVLIIVDENKKVLDLSGSISGVDVKSVKDVSVLDTAPGSRPARLTIFSLNAIEKLRPLKLALHYNREASKSN